MDTYITLRNVVKRYKMGELYVSALDGASFEIEKGEFAIIVGPSGAGKSTVLNILGGMDQCDGGEVIVDGKMVNTYNRQELITYRRHDIGFVFQFYNLMQNLTALENVELASQICKNPLDPKTVMADVGLAGRMDNFPSQLSGGEQQRVSIARALAKNPKLLLCDEPTGALDFATGLQVLHLLKDFNAKYQKTVVIITHNAGIAAMGNRVFHIRDGLIDKVEVNEHPIQPEEVSW